MKGEVVKGLQKSLDAVLSVLYRMGWQPSDFSEGRTVTLRAGTAKREFFLSIASLKEHPLLAMAIPSGFPLPAFDVLYSSYIDFNFEIYLLLKYFEETSPETAYLLYFDESRAFLYDIRGQECLIHCSNSKEREDRLFPLMEKKKADSGSLENLMRKPTEQLAGELSGWLDLWSAKLGAGTQTKRKTLDRFIRKLALARYYRTLFGLESPALLFEGFVNDPERIEASRHRASPHKFLEGLFDHFLDRFSLNLFKSGRADASLLSKADKLHNLLYLFLLEFNLLAKVKFSLEVFLSVWCSESERLASTKKAYTTDRPGLKQRWAVSDMMVLKPVEANLTQDGTPWTLHLFDELVQYWIKYNQTRILQKNETRRRENDSMKNMQGLQLDIFGVSPVKRNQNGTIPNILNFTLQSSIRFSGAEKETQLEVFLFLLCAKCFEMWKKYDLPREPLDSLERALDKGIR